MFNPKLILLHGKHTVRDAVSEQGASMSSGQSVITWRGRAATETAWTRHGKTPANSPKNQAAERTSRKWMRCLRIAFKSAFSFCALHEVKWWQKKAIFSKCSSLSLAFIKLKSFAYYDITVFWGVFLLWKSQHGTWNSEHYIRCTVVLLSAFFYRTNSFDHAMQNGIKCQRWGIASCFLF